MAKKKKELARREKEHLALAHKKMRSLSKFREALADLTTIADEIDKLKSDYFYNALDYHSETWNRVSARSNILLKAELSLYSGVAQKAEHLQWSLVGTPDPWTQELRSSDELFSIVPPQDILARPQSPSHESPKSGLFQSLLGTVQNEPRLSPNPEVEEESRNQQETGESTFFTLHNDLKGLPAMKTRTAGPCEDSDQHSANLRNKSDDNGDQEDSPTTEKDPASPYQDAEELSDQTPNHPAKSIASLSDNIWARSIHRDEGSDLSTPSRPTSRRKNLLGDFTPRKQTHSGADANLKNPLLTPKLERATTDLVPAAQPEANTNNEPDHASPEHDGRKHSEFALHIPSPRKSKEEHV